MESKRNRIESIDLLRGIVIVIMALDHTRDYFHADAMVFRPLDLDKTNVLLFFTRWITHFCAPVFMLLAGTSAFLMSQRKTRRELSFFLFTRGIWLVLLELTVVTFGWTFNIHFPFLFLGVIWALGISMVALSFFVFLPIRAILVSGLLIVFGHNLLDNFHVKGNNIKAFLWSALHESSWGNGSNRFTFDDRIIVLDYPVLPWIGIIALGFCIGYLYQSEVTQDFRRKWLIRIGATAILLFILLRVVNIYGDPSPWSLQTTNTLTFLSFLKVTKYPPSLQFILMTLGTAILFLAFTEKPLNRFGKAIIHFGRVPMFFYMIHIYLIHALAMVAAKFFGHDWHEMVSQEPLTPIIHSYGFSLAVVYIIWMFIVAILYPLCKWYDGYKSSHKEQWWLSYL